MKRHILLEEDRGQLGATTILVDMDAVKHIGMVSTNQEMYFTSTGQLMPITHKQGIQLVIGMHKAGLLDQEHMELLVARIEVRRQQIETAKKEDEWKAQQEKARIAAAMDKALDLIPPGSAGKYGGRLFQAPVDPKTLVYLENQANRRDPFNSYDFGSRAGGYGLGTISASSASPMAPAQSEPAEQAPPSESQD